MARAGLEAFAEAIAQVDVVLAHAPGWIVAVTLALVLIDRILPRKSGDLLELWQSILPARNKSNNGNGKDGA